MTIEKKSNNTQQLVDRKSPMCLQDYIAVIIIGASILGTIVLGAFLYRDNFFYSPTKPYSLAENEGELNKLEGSIEKMKNELVDPGPEPNNEHWYYFNQWAHLKWEVKKEVFDRINNPTFND